MELSRLSKIEWQYLVVDEGHHIKNDKSKLFSALQSFNARHKLLLTGTPLQNGIKVGFC
jgi:SNF2 family DNA or RNA helicase